MEQGELDDLPAVIELDAATIVLTSYGRMNAGTIWGAIARSPIGS